MGDKDKNMKRASRTGLFSVLLLLALISTTFSASCEGLDCVIDGDTVYNTNTYATIKTFPHTATEMIHQTQYTNISYTFPATKIVNISLVFPDEITNGKAFKKASVLKSRSVADYGRVSYLYTINDVTGTTAYDGVESCIVGDKNNSYIRNATLDNGTISYGIYCFDSYIDFGNQTYEINYTKNGITGYHNETYAEDDWVEISDKFTLTKYNHTVENDIRYKVIERIEAVGYEVISKPSSCDVGDLSNSKFYNASYVNGTEEIDNTTVLTYGYFSACIEKAYQTKYDEYEVTYYLNGTKNTTTNYNIYTINNVTFVQGMNLETKIMYDTPIGTEAGKYDIVFHGGSPKDVKQNPSNIYLVLDPWWNNDWEFKIPCTIDTNTTENLTNFPARCSFNTTNTTLWNTDTCANVRFLNNFENETLNYDIDDNSTSYCGNVLNLTDFWILLPNAYNRTGFNSTHNNTIWAYLGNTGVARGEDEKTVWINASAIAVYHGNNKTDATGDFNLTDIQDSMQFSKCLYSKELYWLC